MRNLTAEEKIQRHLDFWEGRSQKRPLTIVRLGDWFFSREFAANKPLLAKGYAVTPDQICVDDYLPDYERMYEDMNRLAIDAFFAAEPCTGFPWMEGIMGAAVYGNENSFITHPVMDDIEQLEHLNFSKENNPWYQKYLEFVNKLTEVSAGRFPVAQPILRGVTDTVGSLIGQEEFACALILEPELLKHAFDQVVDAQRSLIDDQYSIIKPFHGGYSFGFYHIWAPGKIIWFQEDLAALMSPKHFEEFLYSTSCKYIEGYDYSLVHLHPSAFIHLDVLLSIKGLSAIQINKDVGGPTIRDMVPVCRKVLESGKNLVLGMGRIDTDDIDAIYDCLPRERVALNIIAEKREDAEKLIEYIASKK